MDLPNQPVIDLLTYLLPGFVSAAVLYALAPWPRPNPFERVVQALILTGVIQATLVLVRIIALWIGETMSLTPWTEGARLVWSVGIAVGLGLLLSRLSNQDLIHAWLRKNRFTQQTPYPSEWYGALCQHQGYLVLHLPGERRLFGWPEEWPSTPGTGHFVVSEGEWLDGEKRIPLSGVAKVLVPAADVEFVELLTPQLAKAEETSNG